MSGSWASLDAHKIQDLDPCPLRRVCLSVTCSLVLTTSAGCVSITASVEDAAAHPATAHAGSAATPSPAPVCRQGEHHTLLIHTLCTALRHTQARMLSSYTQPGVFQQTKYRETLASSLIT